MKVKIDYGKIKSEGRVILCAERGKEIKAWDEIRAGLREYELLGLEEAGVYWIYLMFWWRGKLYIVSGQVKIPKEKEVVLDLREKRLYEYPDISGGERGKILKIIEEAGFKGVSLEATDSVVRVGMEPKEIDSNSAVLESIQVDKEGGVLYCFSWWCPGGTEEEPQPDEEEPWEEPADETPEEYSAKGGRQRQKAVSNISGQLSGIGGQLSFLDGKAFFLWVKEWGQGRFNVTIGKQILPLGLLVMELPEILRIVKGIGWAVNRLSRG
ncbi:MAG: hypothetical protein HYU63_07005 [Armatimonadetes bacterium]|nr:hypothetical protein [Armatimonadota bacterium]